MLTNIRHRMHRLASIDGDHRRTAAALALGVFLSFSPFLGLQILVGIGAAFALKLSRVAVLLGLCTNLPWIMVPWYALTTAAAAAALGPAEVDIGAHLAEMLAVPVYQAAFWGRTSELLSQYFWPFLVGPTLGAVVLAAAAYVGSLKILRSAGRPRLEPSEPLPTGASRISPPSLPDL